MSDLMRKVLLSRISAAMDGVLTMISKIATRPGLSMRGMQQLRNHRLQHRRKLDANLFLLVASERH